jgi:ADP-L-glycero-D-manno-heptose 6-epimerase
MNMKIILTGANGFIGSCFLWKLNSLGIDQVIAVDAPADIAGSPNIAGKKFKDYLSREALINHLEEGKLKEFDLVVHLGACTDTTERDVAYLKRNNVEYSQYLLQWCLRNERFFHYASSASIYGDGKEGYSDDLEKLGRYKALNFYGDSKLTFDKWLVAEKLTGHVAGFRYFNVFGPNEYYKGEMQSMVSKAFRQIEQNDSVDLFASSRPGFSDGSEERDFVYVKDVVEVMSWFLSHPEERGIFNVGTGKARFFKDLITAVFKALKKPVKINYIPMPEKLKGQYQYFTQADLSNLRAAGCSVPFRSLEDSVTDYVQNHLLKPNPHL